MKVCTDSCLFGAWMADKLFKKEMIASTILDIGTGTGLLRLMLSQKTIACIDAVEINENDFEQAKENIKLSPWKNNINVFHADIKTWNANKKYDLIICNPPFYENDLKSSDKQKNISKHNDGLTIDEVISAGSKLLNTGGHFAVLIPFHRSSFLEKSSQNNSLFVNEKAFIRQSTSHDFYRSIFILQKEKTSLTQKEISIKYNSNGYTKEFTELLKDYYLAL